MIERLLENWLDNASERSYQSVFVQILSAQGHRVVHSTRHNALEYGKDVLAVTSDGSGCAYQLKGHPNGKLGLSQFRKEIQPQLIQLMSQAVVYPGFPQGPHKSFLVSNGYFEEEVQRAVDDLNRMSYLSKVSLLSRGDLVSWCNELGTSLWPSELHDSRLLLEIFLSDHREILPVSKLSELLGKVLLLKSSEAEFSSKAEFYRAMTSAALLTGIATSGFAEVENHFAVSSAWTLFAVSIIAAANKHEYELDKAAMQSLILAETAICDALAGLWDEVFEHNDLVEGNAFTDHEVYRWRHTTILGLLSCLALYDEVTLCLSEENREKLKQWLLQRHTDIHLWGEGTVANLVPWLVWMRKNDATLRPDQEIANLVKTVIYCQKRSDSPLPSPYYSFEEVLRHQMHLDKLGNVSQIAQETFAGRSYTSEALLHLLVRTNLKQECKRIWPDFTRLSHLVCIPDNAWEYCTPSVKSGANQTKIYPSTYNWADLKNEAICTCDAALPKELAQRPWLLALWWQIAPFRYTTESSQTFIEGVFPGWGA